MFTASPQDTTSAGSPRKLKILMLHGYTQSGPNFHSKTRALEKALKKAFPAQPPAPHKPLPGSLPAYPGGVELFYPTGPKRLRASDIPGFAPTGTEEGGGSREDEILDSWGWWTRDASASKSGAYAGIEDGFATIATAIRQAGGVDAVIGFSQGATAAAMVAALLEEGRYEAFAAAAQTGGIEYPASFLADPTRSEAVNPPLKFAVAYCGFYSPYVEYRAFYEPKIRTPMLHVIGSLDTVVEETRSLDLAARCERQTTVHHPGGHFVPIGKDMAGALVGFIRETCGERRKTEQSIENMDLPF
ncbi:MAG: hypothetical protein M1818_004964 [Claussenomyces sp. TS43310]|nr:MAG: hypothetical protein M1818_004964 [Claussenomyces sp. TS43310]